MSRRSSTASKANSKNNNTSSNGDGNATDYHSPTRDPFTAGASASLESPSRGGPLRPRSGSATSYAQEDAFGKPLGPVGALNALSGELARRGSVKQASIEACARERRMSLSANYRSDGRRASVMAAGFSPGMLRRRTVASERTEEEKAEALKTLKLLFGPILVRCILGLRKNQRWPGDIPPRDYSLEAIVSAIKASKSILAKWPEDLLGLLASDAVVRYLEPRDPIVYRCESHLSCGIVVLLYGKMSDKRREQPVNKSIAPSQRPIHTKKSRERVAPDVLCDEVVLCEDASNSLLCAEEHADVALIPSRWFWDVVHNNAAQALAEPLMKELRAFLIPNRQELLSGPYYPTALLLRRSWLWYDFSSKQRKALASTITPSVFVTGDVVFTEGKRNPYVYIVRRGTLLVTRNGVSLTYIESGSCFGEVSALMNDVRATTVVATSTCELYALHRRYFLDVLNSSSSLFEKVVKRLLARRAQWLENGKAQPVLGLASMLARVPSLSHTNDAMRVELAKASVARVLSPGETLVRQGEDCNLLFVVGRGVAVEVNPTSGTPTLYTAGQYFGEFLLYPHQWPFTIACAEDAGCDVWMLSAEMILGVLQKSLVDAQAIELCKNGVELYKKLYGTAAASHPTENTATKAKNTKASVPTTPGKRRASLKPVDPGPTARRFSKQGGTGSRKTSESAPQKLTAGKRTSTASTTAETAPVTVAANAEVILPGHSEAESFERWRQWVIGAACDDDTEASTEKFIIDGVQVFNNVHPSDVVPRKADSVDKAIEKGLQGHVSELFSVPEDTAPHAADCDFATEGSDVQQVVVVQVLLTETEKHPALLRQLNQSNLTLVAYQDDVFEEAEVFSNSSDDLQSPLYTPPPRAICELGAANDEEMEDDALREHSPKFFGGNVTSFTTNWLVSNGGWPHEDMDSALGKQGNEEDDPFASFKDQDMVPARRTTLSVPVGGLREVRGSFMFPPPDPRLQKGGFSGSNGPPPLASGVLGVGHGIPPAFPQLGQVAIRPRSSLRPSSAVPGLPAGRRSIADLAAGDRRGSAVPLLPGWASMGGYAASESSQSRSRAWSTANTVDLSQQGKSKAKLMTSQNTMALDRYVKLEDQDYFGDWVKVIPMAQDELVDLGATAVGTSDLNSDGPPILLLMHVVGCDNLSGLRIMRDPIVKVECKSRVLIRTPSMNSRHHPKWPIEAASFISFLGRSHGINFVVCDAGDESNVAFSASMATSDLHENGGVGIRRFELIPKEDATVDDVSRQISDASEAKKDKKKKKNPILTVCMLAVTATKYKALKGVAGSKSHGHLEGPERSYSTTEGRGPSHNESTIHLQILGVEGLRHRIEASVKVLVDEIGEITTLLQTPKVTEKTRAPVWAGEVAFCRIQSDGIVNFELWNGPKLFAVSDVPADSLAFDGVGIHRYPLYRVSQDVGSGMMVGTLCVSVLSVSLPSVEEALQHKQAKALFLCVEGVSIAVGDADDDHAGMLPDPIVVVTDESGDVVLKTPMAFSTEEAAWSIADSSCILALPPPGASPSLLRFSVYDNCETALVGSATVEMEPEGFSHPRFELPFDNGRGFFRVQASPSPIQVPIPARSVHGGGLPLKGPQHARAVGQQAALWDGVDGALVAVHVESCEGLVNTGYAAFKAEPIVVVRFRQRRLLVTPAASEDTNPTWALRSSCFVMHLPPVEKVKGHLTLEVYDANLEKDDLIGVARLQLRESCGTARHSIPLSSADTGKMEVSLRKTLRCVGTINVSSYVVEGLNNQTHPQGHLRRPSGRPGTRGKEPGEVVSLYGVHDTESDVDSEGEAQLAEFRLHVSSCAGVRPQNACVLVRVTVTRHVEEQPHATSGRGSHVGLRRSSNCHDSGHLMFYSAPSSNTSGAAWLLSEASCIVTVPSAKEGKTKPLALRAARAASIATAEKKVLFRFRVEAGEASTVDVDGAAASAQAHAKPGEVSEAQPQGSSEPRLSSVGVSFVEIGEAIATLDELVGDLAPGELAVRTLTVVKAMRKNEISAARQPTLSSATPIAAANANDEQEITLTLSLLGVAGVV